MMWMKAKSKIFWIVILILYSLQVYSNSDRLAFIHYTNEDGLPSSYIKNLCQDRYGFIWAATRSSVCRFDGKYFKTFQTKDEEGNLSDIWGMKLFLDSDSTLLVLSTDNRFYYFDYKSELFIKHPLLNNFGTISDLQINEKGMWVIGAEAVHFLPTGKSDLLQFDSVVDFARLDSNARIVNIREKNGMLVVLTSQNEIMVFDLQKRLQRSFQLPDNISISYVSRFYIDQNNYVWIATYDSGVHQIDLNSGRSRYFSSNTGENTRLLHNMVHTIEEDHQGRVWIGTENGLCVWSPYTETFDYYQYDINIPDGLNTNPIYDIFCDNDGDMWLGTYFGGINFWSSNVEFFKVWQAGTSDMNIGGSAVSSITEDRQGNIWIGMEDMGVNKINSQTGKVTHYVSSSSGLTFNNVHSLLFETDQKLWIGTYTGGINVLNTQNGKFSYINTRNYPNLPSNNIYDLLMSGDSIYIASSAGTAVYNLRTNELTRFLDETFHSIQVEFMYGGGDRLWLSSQIGVFYYDKKEQTLSKFDGFPFLSHVNFVKTDSKNRVWIGDCLEGLCCYDPSTNDKKQYNEKNGFPFSWIFSLEEGSDGTFWVSGDKGLAKFNPETGEHTLFNRDSDIPFEQFNYRASFKDSRGNIFFGGNNGMISFDENSKLRKKVALKVVFRGMQLFNQLVVPGKESVLSESLNLHPEIHLKHKQNVFTIEYSGLNFQYRGKCQYAYYLENFDNDWNYVGNRDFATYTNLSPGEYIFHVKAAVDASEWPGTSNSIKIIIEPPFWLSKWGFFIYFIIIVLALIGFYNITTRIQKAKAIAEMERREKEYITELNNFKLEFFTNVSHELRTPLTLIIGPLSKILQEENLSPGLVKKMKGIKNNAHRLLSLINQLLEFRKIERGKETLKVSHQNITTLLADIQESFAGSAKTKGIKLKFNVSNLDKEIWVDGLKLENILINLISNALKFTEKGGKVKVAVSLESSNESGDEKLFIEVSDTGIGIEPDKKNKIFDRFYKDEMNLVNQSGAGIGLAYVNSLVKIHRGKIEVESEIGKGSVFKVQIPVSRTNYEDNEIILGQTQFIPELNVLENNISSPKPFDNILSSGKKPSVLVIDDNEELLGFISETLTGEFITVTARSGEEGLEKINEQLPDLIISDVMMPGIDGFELCRKLKNDIKTSHIPVILLTAKSGEESEYEGLMTGADYFIEKPFFPHILNKLIDNILATRKNLIERFKSDITMMPGETAYSDSDRELIEKLTSLIRTNIDKENLDVTFLVNGAGISRSLLHMKLKNLTGCSATEFIRSIRLREAVKLIAEGKCNISEAAYRTGFSSPAYFTRRFKEFFGTSPKQYFEN